MGSNPITSTINGHLDQWLDPRSHKPVVLGSNPRMPTTTKHKSDKADNIYIRCYEAKVNNGSDGC